MMTMKLEEDEDEDDDLMMNRLEEEHDHDHDHDIIMMVEGGEGGCSLHCCCLDWVDKLRWHWRNRETVENLKIVYVWHSIWNQWITVGSRVLDLE